MLIEEWYVARHERGEHLKEVVALKATKEQARKQPAVTAPSPPAAEGQEVVEEVPAAAPTPDD